MKKNLSAKYVEEVPETEIFTANPTWYLPIFDVTHPKKQKIRLVYDASARYQDTSLNDSLMSGPDLNNHLRGVLLRFREKPVAFTADIESMFSTLRSMVRSLVLPLNGYELNVLLVESIPEASYESDLNLSGEREEPGE